jgi:hypothetical protein
MTEVPITVREVIRLLWEADSYPCIGNEDWHVAARMEAAALAKAATAVASPDDPPEFGRWLDALRNGGLTVDERVDSRRSVRSLQFIDYAVDRGERSQCRRPIARFTRAQGLARMDQVARVLC